VTEGSVPPAARKRVKAKREKENELVKRGIIDKKIRNR
jgi:hypothetical protein